MFICNVRMNKNLLTKLLIIFFLITILIVFVIVGKRFYNKISVVRINDDISTNSLEINSNNYADILKDSHDNIEKYIGKKVKFVGFVYRLFDFSENQFVLAREMIISSDNHAVVVGFLSEFNNAKDFEEGSWVEAEGVIQKGNYHGDLPIIKIQSMKKTSAPVNQYVNPPSSGYITTEI